MCLSTHYAVTVVDAAGVVVAYVVVAVVDVFAGDVVDGVNVGAVVVVVVVFAVAAVVVDDEDLSDDVCNEVEFGQEMLR